MSQSAFPALFSPFSRGRLTVTNRLVMLPHGTSMVRDGIPTEDDLAYFAARVRGVGLVITGATVAHPSAVVRQRNRVEAFDKRVLPALSRRTAMVKSHGGVIVGQLNHVGRETVGSESDFPPVSASARRAARDPYPPHALDDGEILDLVQGFADAAANLQAAGYDGVELHAAHGYLLAQFLSPATNDRTDRWGGTPEKRLRFLKESIERVRERCGDGFLVGVRLSADEEIAGGLAVRDTAAIGRSLAVTGAVDYLSLTIGVRGGYIKDVTFPEAPAARVAGIVRSECGLPVIVGQKVASPETAERLLAEGVADLVGMARAFIADPAFAIKAGTGLGEPIRPCVGLNQDCRTFSPHIHCAVNPQTGRERQPEFGPLRRAVHPSKVAVVGGGPAGMEAARIAALRGHEVTLFEASDALGGQFLLAASLPHRSGLLRFTDYLIGEVRRHDVAVKLGTRIDDVASLAAAFETVIVATGAIPGEVPAEELGLRVVSWWDVLTKGAPAPSGGGNALFADDGGGFWTSYGIVEMLAEAGWRVTFATPSAAIGGGVPPESLGALLGRLGRAGTRYRVLTHADAGADGCARLIDLASGEEEQAAFDLFVRQTGRLACRPEATNGRDEYRAATFHVGDCVTPRRISHALFEAQRVTRTLA